MAACPRHIAAFAACFAVSILAGCSHSHDDSSGKLRIVTQNVYQGTSFQEIEAAKSPAAFVQAVSVTYGNIKATNPAERASAIAKEIASASPHLVALQEASMVRTGAPPASSVQWDLVELVMAELDRLGLHYTLVSKLQTLDAEAPSTLGFDVRVTMQDAVLARSDLDGFSWSNVQAQRYQAVLQFPSPVGNIPFPRGYISLDVSLNGHAFRFVTTHLEVEPHFEAAQASELAAIEAASPLPVLIAGDFNSAANDPNDPSYAGYKAMTTAGFADAWAAAHPQDAGFTCCEPANVANATPTLTQRIDLVLTKGDWKVDGIELIGVNAADRTPSGLWPSDHAGIAAELAMP